MPAVRRILPIALLLASAVVHAQTTPAEPPKKNVLFLICDDLNADLGCYGHPLVKSPNIDRLAARGVRFDRTYCQYPLCNPSRSSFLTGRYPFQTGILTNGPHFRKFIPDVVTLPQYFRNHGYFVARVGKLYHYGVPGDIGTDGLDDPPSWEAKANPRGLDREVQDRIHCIVPNGPLGSSLSWLRLESKDEEQTDGVGATEAIKFLEANDPKKTGKPFFLAFGCYRPHSPYVAPGKYFDLYPREKIVPVIEKPGDRDDIPPCAVEDKPNQRDVPLEKRKEIIQAYFASISYADAQLGRVLDALERLGLAQDTVVVFTSDHGYLLGEHGLWQKHNLFEPTARVPLVIAEPGSAQAGKTSKALVEMVDFYPTLAELAGLPPPAGASGRSLVPVLRDPAAAHREAAFTVCNARRAKADPPGLKKGGRKPAKGGEDNAGGGREEQILGYSIRTDRYRYTEWGDGGEAGVELYDEEKDPDEYVNLAEDPAQTETVKKLKDLLRKSAEAAR